LDIFTLEDQYVGSEMSENRYLMTLHVLEEWRSHIKGKCS